MFSCLQIAFALLASADFERGGPVPLAIVAVLVVVAAVVSVLAAVIDAGELLDEDLLEPPHPAKETAAMSISTGSRVRILTQTSLLLKFWIFGHPQPLQKPHLMSRIERQCFLLGGRLRLSGRGRVGSKPSGSAQPALPALQARISQVLFSNVLDPTPPKAGASRTSSLFLEIEDEMSLDFRRILLDFGKCAEYARCHRHRGSEVVEAQWL